MAAAQTLLDIAARDIGYTESPPGSNSTKFGRWFGLDGYAWCMMAVQYWFDRAGAASLLPRKTASCTELAEAAKKAGLWVTRDFRPGDVVMFDWSGKGKITEHVGLVERAGSWYVVTIEGNTASGDHGSQSNGGGVFRRKRDLKYVTGAVRPRYESMKEVSTVELNDFVERATDEQLLRLFDRLQTALAKKALTPGSKLEEELAKAKLAGITDGSGPYQIATRAQAAVMAFRAR